MGKHFWESDDDYRGRVNQEANEQTIESTTGSAPSQRFWESDGDYRERIGVEASEAVVESSTGSEPSQGWFESDEDYRSRVIQEANECMISDSTGTAPSQGIFESDEHYRSRVSQEANQRTIDDAGTSSARGWFESDRDYKNRLYTGAREIRSASQIQRPHSGGYQDGGSSGTQHSGGQSKSRGHGFFWFMLAILLGGLAYGAFVVSKSKSGIPIRSQEATMKLSEAKAIIPPDLAKIYRSLDAGDPQALAGMVNPEMLRNDRQLDQICRPFSYRGHYIESIIERPDGNFEARVHLLLRPLDEHVDLFTFVPYKTGLFLTSAQEIAPQSLESERQEAIAVARRFIFATSAGKRDEVRRLVSPHLDVTPLFEDGDYSARAQDVSTIAELGAGFQQENGLKVGINVTTGRRKFCGDLWHIVVDTNGNSPRIVEWGFVPIFGCYTTFGPPMQDKHIDPEMESYTLRRFGLTTPREDALAAEPERVDSSVAMSQEIPKLSDQSQTNDISGSETGLDTGGRAQADTNIDRWLEQFVSASEGPSTEALRVFYADTVSPYFAMQSASWADIQHDKETYFKRFPKIHYSVVGTPQFSELGDGDRVIGFTIDYSVMRKDGKVSTGHYHDKVTVRAINGILRVVGVEEEKDQ